MSTELHMSSAMSTFNDPQLDCDYTLVSTDPLLPGTPSVTADQKYATSMGFRNAAVSNQFADLWPKRSVKIFCGPYKAIFKRRKKLRPAAVAAAKELEARYKMVHALQMEKIARDAEALANAPDAAPDARRTADELITSAMMANVRADASIGLASIAANEARARGSAFTTVKNSGDAFVMAMAADLEHKVAIIEKEDAATIQAKLSRAGVEMDDPDSARLMGEVFNSAETYANMTGIARNMSVKAAEMVEMAEQNPNEAADEMATGALEMASDALKMVHAAFDVKNRKILEFSTILHDTYPAARNITPAMVARKLFCDDVPVQARHIKVFMPDQSFSAMYQVPRQFSFKTGA